MEEFLNKLLLLDATLPRDKLSGQGCPDPSQCELLHVNRDTLFSFHPLPGEIPAADSRSACGLPLQGAFKGLRAYFRRRNDRAGELRATLRLGTTYYSAGLLVAASQLFEEGVRISRELGDQEREGLCSTMLQRIAGGAANV